MMISAVMLFCSSMAAEKSVLKVKMFDEFHVFYSNDLTAEMASVLRYEDQTLVLADGKKIDSVTLKQTGELLDFRTVCSDKAITRAAAVTAVYADKPGVMRVGAGADWWFAITRS